MWQLQDHSPLEIDLLVKQLGVSPHLAKSLLARGMHQVEEAVSYLNPSLKNLTLPTVMHDFEKARDRVVKALKSGERIGVFGDYDVDGITSAAILGGFISSITDNTDIRVGVRDDGYGFSANQFENWKDSNISLLVIADCGTNDLESISKISALGVDVVVIDHHQIMFPDKPWPGYALVNPQLKDCGFPFKGLCSAGLAFYLISSIRTQLDKASIACDDPKDYMDLVAIATVADVVPLRDENRILVANGLRRIMHTGRPGLRKMLELTKLAEQPVTTRDIGWKIGPRINAPGRIDDANISLRCLYERDESIAVDNALQCEEINQARRDIQDAAMKQALEQVAEREERDFVVAASSEWHAGIVGILAGRLADKYQCPAAVISIMEGEARGSVRSVPGVNVIALMSQCESLFSKFGGHPAAAGFSLLPENVESLRLALNEAAKKDVRKGGGERTLSLDGLLSLEEIDFDLCKELQSLQPFGEGNPEPIYGSALVKVESVRIVGDNHLRMQLSSGDRQFPAIGFSLGHKKPLVGDSIDIAFIPEIDNFRGPKVQLRILDLATGGAGIRS